MKATKKITSHKNWNASDYNHLSEKGYTNSEILAIWDRDAAQGKGPCGVWTWNSTLDFFTK